MKNKFLYLLMPSLLPGILQGGEATPTGSAAPPFGQLSPISHTSSNGASLGRFHNALQELCRSSQSCSSSVDSSIGAFDVLGKKRVRSLSSLSQERFLDGANSELSEMSDEVSVGSFSYDEQELVNGSIPLDLGEVSYLKNHGCDLTGEEGLPYELIGHAPNYTSAKDHKKCKITTEAKQLLTTAQGGNPNDLTKFITCLRRNPNLTKWYDARFNTLAECLVDISCNEQAQTVDRNFLEQILKRTRSAQPNSANPVFRKFHAVAAHIKEETEQKKCESCNSLIRGNCDYCPAWNFRWHKNSISNGANEIFFETPDNKLSERKCQAAARLATAIEVNDAEAVDALMAANPKVPFYCDDRRYFPMQYAAKFNRPDLIAKFSDAGVHPDHSYDGMLTPLQLAVVHGNLEAVKKLLQLGASPNKEIYYGNQIDNPTPTAYMTSRSLASVLAKGNQPNAKRICLALEQNRE